MRGLLVQNTRSHNRKLDLRLQQSRFPLELWAIVGELDEREVERLV
jgi:hypothetical protein